MDPKHYSEDEDRELIKRCMAFMVAVTDSARADYLRRQKHWHKEILYDDVLNEMDLSYSTLQPYPDAISDFEFEERRISDALSKLSLLRRRILTLRFVYGFHSQEIADILGCSVEFVYLHKHRAIKKLRDDILRGGESDGRH